MKNRTSPEKAPASNAKKAFSELTSFLSSEKETAPTQEKKLPVSEPTVDKDSPKHDVNVSKKTMSLVSNNTTITGNLSTEGDLNIEGNILGDTIASGNITVTGTVKGNIQADCLTISKGHVISELIKVAKNVIIEDGAEVVGNIQCENIICNAKITGNLLVNKKCDIKISSVIQGDIRAKELSVQTGAVLLGKVEIAKDSVK